MSPTDIPTIQPSVEVLDAPKQSRRQLAKKIFVRSAVVLAVGTAAYFATQKLNHGDIDLEMPIPE